MNHRKFTFEDQIAFAELSGDYNPIHIDAVAARRLLFGSPVVHGIHSLLWALDSWLEDRTDNVEFCSIKAAFPRPIRVGDEVSLSLKEDAGHVRINLLCGESIVTTIEVAWDKSQQRNFDHLETRFPEKLQPRALLEDEIEAKSGTLDLCLNIEAAAKIFPHLIRCVYPLQIAILLGTTRLVGVECPGLHSLYSELSLFASDSHECTTLKYEVTKSDRRFGLVVMKVMTPVMTGVIKAFVRPTPQEQDSYLNIKELVGSNEFSGQRALVIGGSRGLGEVTAKLLTAGAANVKLTYHQGAEDAHRVVDEIISGHGSADSFFLDVLDNQINVAECLGSGWKPTHLYYFATPFIALGTNGVFSAPLFQKFCNYYIIGFQRIVEQLSSFGLKGFFFPSSVFVDELPLNMGEYAIAKMAGEVLCAFIKKTKKEMTIYKPRLPRMATDQTTNVMRTSNLDPVSIMLEHLRSFRDSPVAQ